MTSSHLDHLALSSTSPSARLGAGTLIILIALISLSAAAGAILYLGWTIGGGIELPRAGYIAMAADVIFSLEAGFGLMAFVIFRVQPKRHDERRVDHV
jgi:hypothetical protein